ncbi:unnamed protein product [Cylicocyclus nassatus]|uniref:Uncharacterized protein n=1 Tax=Cylicocyclus nassatus TaxID=53992 RepID=A0AA36GN32_CYLNA|nr:unnamed protein product [Cylicocyclus nassatus]
MFTFGNNSAASHDAERQAELTAREAAREVVRNSSTPTLEELVRSISPFSPECFGEDVEASSPPSSGRAFPGTNPTARGGAERRQEAGRRSAMEQRRAHQRAEGNAGRMQAARKESHPHGEDLRTVHNVLPKALEAHRAKLRALHPEEEEELLHHFLQKGNVVETFIEIITHGEGMVRVTTDRDEFFFAARRGAERRQEAGGCSAMEQRPARQRTEGDAGPVQATRKEPHPHGEDLRAVHEVLPKALEAHRAKLRALHPEEEEELLHHFLQKGNVVETFIEIITQVKAWFA